jgi:hypothetical protein
MSNENKLDMQGYYKEVDELVYSDEMNAIPVQKMNANAIPGTWAMDNKIQPFIHTNPSMMTFSEAENSTEEDSANHGDYDGTGEEIPEAVGINKFYHYPTKQGHLEVLNPTIMEYVSVPAEDRINGQKPSQIHNSIEMMVAAATMSAKIDSGNISAYYEPSMTRVDKHQNKMDNYYVTANPIHYQPSSPPSGYFPASITEQISYSKNAKPSKHFKKTVTPKKTIDMEELNQISEKLVITKNNEESTMIYAVVNSLSNQNINSSNYLKCNGGVCLKGYPYDTSKDAYIVSGCHTSFLGTIPFSLVATIPSTGEWSTSIPIPKDLIKNNISPNSLKLLEDIENNFPADHFSIQFVQMIKE